MNQTPNTRRDGRRATSEVNPRHASAATRHALVTRHSGIALVVTLLLLSIITFMAITFLVVSRSHHSTVANQTDQTVAQQAADSALARFASDASASMMAFGDPSRYDLAVSTNYINPAGFTSGNASYTNVNYYYANGAQLTPGSPKYDFEQNLQNLLYDPRPPVYVTNRTTRTMEARYYLDLNRNGRFDPTGGVRVTNDLNAPVLDANGNFVTNSVVGDPQWVGILQKPGSPHSPTNPFTSRYAFIVIPVSKTIDVNYIHNYAKNKDDALGANVGDCFLRDQGAATYEINLGSFLADLNTNLWNSVNGPYLYNWNPVGGYWTYPNTGFAFDDALSILRYRYKMASAPSFFLPSADQLFGTGARVFRDDFVDLELAGPPMTGAWPVRDYDTVNVLKRNPCFAADNTNHYFTTQEFFDPSKTSLAFVNRLTLQVPQILSKPGGINDLYNRYTYYRMLAQLGTESAPESGRLNLNYANVDAGGNIVPNMATNFIPWTPVQFFTNAAIRLLGNAGYSVGSGILGSHPTNILRYGSSGATGLQIQIYPTNFYTASLHQMLQLAANMYDASTNRSFGAASNGFPSMFRPVFSTSQGRVYISDYAEDGNATDPNSALNIPRQNWHELSSGDIGPWQNPTRQMVYGIPLVVGARKGFPNFNQFAMQTPVAVTRKLSFRRLSLDPGSPDFFRFHTNQMYNLGVTNTFGVQAWNSYSNAYPRDLQVYTYVDMLSYGTNEFGALMSNSVPFSNWVYQTTVTNGAVGPFGPAQTIPANTWQGLPLNYQNSASTKYSFLAPIPQATNSFSFLPAGVYSFSLKRLLVPLSTNDLGDLARTGDAANQFPIPHWWVGMRARLRFVLVDTGVTPYRIIDFVNLSSHDPPVDLTAALQQGATHCGSFTPLFTPATPNDANLWCTNRANNSSLNQPTYGVLYQIAESMNPNDPANWQFIYDMTGVWRGPATTPHAYRTNEFEPPYQASRQIFVNTTWQANDPLVHYTVDDLQVRTNQYDLDTVGSSSSGIDHIVGVNPGIGAWGSRLWPRRSADPMSPRFGPWGRPGSVTGSDYQLALKDPHVSRSDDWLFPTNKYPNIGWLGRVHRGTPWQTVYLKAAPPPFDPASPSDAIIMSLWQKWSGDFKTNYNYGQFRSDVMTNGQYFVDSRFSRPTNDWHILDLFTTAFNDNAARGRLNINQTNLAAWSAVLGGVIVLSNTVASSDQFHEAAPEYAAVSVQPAGGYGPASPPPLARILNSINDVRRTNFTQGAFSRLGDILSVPELTVGAPTRDTNGNWVGVSPYLNLGAVAAGNALTVNQRYGLDDAAYERLPQQVLNLLDLQPPRLVIYSWGQTLKPADNSRVSSGPYSGLCTNYQVTAEVATRAVVRISGAPNNPHIDIESYNVLPPD